MTKPLTLRGMLPSYRRRHKEPWNIQQERREEAYKPGPEENLEWEYIDFDTKQEETVDDAGGHTLSGHFLDGCTGSDYELIDFETINTTSARTNQKTLLEREAHITAMQQDALTPAQIKMLQIAAAKDGKRFEGGPLGPEHGRTSAGEGILSLEGLTLYPIPKPSDNYHDADATGRRSIYCMDLGSTTLVIAVLYGWTGGEKDSWQQRGRTTSSP